MTIETMKLALKALEEAHPKPYNESVISHVEAITAIRTAIERTEKQEPVAWVREHELPLAPGDAFSWVETLVHKTPLYTTPPAAQPAPAQQPVNQERESLRAAQGEAVMPLIGPLLDAWESCSETMRGEQPEVDKYLRKINRAMEDATPPAAQREPAPGYCKHCKQYTIEEPLPAAQRQPLTDEQITQICVDLWSGGWRETAMRNFARAIEAAHGIKEKNNAA
jgi:hypothetical protein